MTISATLRTTVHSTVGAVLTVVVGIAGAPGGALLGGMLTGTLEGSNLLDAAVAGTLSGLLAAIVMVSLGIYPLESQYFPSHIIGWFLTLHIYILLTSTVGGIIGGILHIQESGDEL